MYTYFHLNSFIHCYNLFHALITITRHFKNFHIFLFFRSKESKISRSRVFIQPTKILRNAHHSKFTHIGISKNILCPIPKFFRFRFFLYTYAPSHCCTQRPQLLDKRIYKTEMKFWAILGSRGCREKKPSNCHK